MLKLGDVELKYGELLQATIDFLIIAFSVFVAIKLIGALRRKSEEAPAAPAPKPDDVVLLEQIRDILQKTGGRQISPFERFMPVPYGTGIFFPLYLFRRRRESDCMTSPLRLLAFALLLAPSLLPAAENQRFILERPYPVAEIPEPDRSLPVTNVILMIGDGMGIHHLSAAWAANRGRLFIENCPVTGISKTWCADKLVTDSAAAGTAMATGTKTLYHRVAVCPKGNRLDSLVDKAADMGKSTGVIATCELNDATPASFCANNEKDRMPTASLGITPVPAPISSLAAAANTSRRGRTAGISSRKCRRRDTASPAPGKKPAPCLPGKTLAVTAPGNLPPPSKRGDVFRQAALKALDTLSRNPDGFFLMIEGSNIDKAAHSNNLEEMMEELLDF